VLEQMERSLAKFQHDVSTFGTEIKKLQDNCLQHQVQIANRKVFTIICSILNAPKGSAETDTQIS
jgi:hypothetical protein